MKIEKLTDDKIRIIINSLDLKELKDFNIDPKAIFSKTIDSQGFFLDILEKARVELGFNTDGCKILVEAFSNSDEYIVFTITKYADSKSIVRKQPIVKRKTLDLDAKNTIYRLTNFDAFCDLCTYLSNNFNNTTKISKQSSLYLYNNCYYLLIKNVNKSILKDFYVAASEFFSPSNFSCSFENKLLEHGRAIIKTNAICTCIKYFVH